MGKKETIDLIAVHIDIEDHTHAEGILRLHMTKFQHDIAGEILIAEITDLIVVTDSLHAAQILHQTAVGVFLSRLIKEVFTVGVGVEHQLHGVDDGGLATAGVTSKEVDLLIERQDLFTDVVPVVQAHTVQCQKIHISHGVPPFRRRPQSAALPSLHFFPLHQSHPDLPPRRTSPGSRGHSHRAATDGWWGR